MTFMIEPFEGVFWKLWLAITKIFIKENYGSYVKTISITLMNHINEYW